MKIETNGGQGLIAQDELHHGEGTPRTLVRAEFVEPISKRHINSEKLHHSFELAHLIRLMEQLSKFQNASNKS
jgi:hypothetical protein